MNDFKLASFCLRQSDIPGQLELVTQTTRTYLEADGSNKAVKRVRVLGPNGEVIRSYLEDEMGARFRDNLGWPDRQ